jgi:hypothetical protein
MTHRSEKLVWLPPFETPSELGIGPDLELGELGDADLDAAERLAALHLEVASGLPTDSQIRALTLRCGGHWSRLAGLPRRGLTRVP